MAGRGLVGVEREERLLHVVVVGRLVHEAVAEPVHHDRVGRRALDGDEARQLATVVLLVGHHAGRVPPGLVHVR